MNLRISLTLLTITMMAMLMFFACSSQTPNDPEDPEQPVANQTVSSASKASVDIYQNVSSFQQTTGLMEGTSSIVEMEVPDFGNPEESTALAKRVQAQSFASLGLDAMTLNKTMADSTIWDVTERDSIEGVTKHIKLVYDDQTGFAKLIVVQFDYRDNHPLQYDSTLVEADLNFTLLDDQDDVLIRIYNLKRYRSGHLIHEEVGTFEPGPYDAGTEPDSGVLTNDITYGSSSAITSTQTRLEYDASEGGSYSKTSNFSDNTTHEESATFTLQGTGTFSETKRDGTRISGTFDGMEEDNSGSYSKTTTFPDGHDPASVIESGTFSSSNGGNTFSGSVSKETTYLNGDKETESATVEQTTVGEVVTTTINAENDDGHGFISIVETPDVDQVSGEWTNADETFVVFTAQSYADGSVHLEFKLYESEVAFENGDGPIAEGTFDFYPDGSGSGTVVDKKENKEYEITIGPDGDEEVVEKG